jgi:hypothetical protein
MISRDRGLDGVDIGLLRIALPIAREQRKDRKQQRAGDERDRANASKAIINDSVMR